MAEVTLTEERHRQLVSGVEIAGESIVNANTILANLTIDTDELLQDLQGAIEVLEHARNFLEDF